MFVCGQKIKFILHVFLDILQRYCKLIVSGTLGMPGNRNPKRYCQLEENFRVYLQAKNPKNLPCFSGDIAKINKLVILGTLGTTCLVAHTQNDSINLYKTSMFICKPKIDFIIHFFLEILHFKESCNLIGWQHFGP